jgi:hypothetical protein
MAMNKSSVTVLRASLIIVALTIAGYILGPPLYWHFKEALAAVKHSSSSSPSTCAPCHCDCSSQPTFSIPQGIVFFATPFHFLYFYHFSLITHLKILLKISSFLNWVI